MGNLCERASLPEQTTPNFKLKLAPTDTPSQSQPEGIKYIENQEEKGIEFAGSNKSFQFQNYKRFKTIRNISKYFDIERELGKGSFGEVFLATHK